jgi:hypothetical protein
MDDLLLDQIEWLLAQSSSSARYERQIISLVGFLADEQIPESITQQVRALSKQVTLRDIFDTLVASLNSFAPNRSHVRAEIKREETMMDLSPLIAQIEAARVDLSTCEPVCHAELIAWIMAKAKQRKIFQERRGRR